MTRKIFKFSDDRKNFLEIGMLTDDNEIIYHTPQPLKNTNISQYSPCFYIVNENGEYDLFTNNENYDVFYPKKVRKEITTNVEGLSCSIGYIDHKDSVVFYDQYL